MVASLRKFVLDVAQCFPLFGCCEGGGVFDESNEWLGSDNPIDCFVVEVSAGIVFASFGSCWRPWLAWWAGKVEGEVFNGIRDDVTEGLRDRGVWKVGLNEFAASRVGVGGRFVRRLDAEEAERERWSSHSGEVRGEGYVYALLYVVVRVQ